MTVDELAELLEAVPCYFPISIAVKLIDDQILYMPVTGIAKINIKEHSKGSPQGKAWILAENPCWPFIPNLWAPELRVKR